MPQTINFYRDCREVGFVVQRCGWGPARAVIVHGDGPDQSSDNGEPKIREDPGRFRAGRNGRQEKVAKEDRPILCKGASSLRASLIDTAT